MVTGDWLDVGALVEIPLRGARTIKTAGSDEIAIFRTAANKVYALINRCPHKRGHLSQGIVRLPTGAGTTTFPEDDQRNHIHSWNVAVQREHGDESAGHGRKRSKRDRRDTYMRREL